MAFASAAVPDCAPATAALDYSAGAVNANTRKALFMGYSQMKRAVLMGHPSAFS